MTTDCLSNSGNPFDYISEYDSTENKIIWDFLSYNIILIY